MATIGSLVINLLANTTGFTQQMEGARKTASKFGQDVESAIGGSATESVMRAVRVMGHLRAATAASTTAFHLLHGDIQSAAEAVKKLPFGMGEFARSLEESLGLWTGITADIENANRETKLMDETSKSMKQSWENLAAYSANVGKNIAGMRLDLEAAQLAGRDLERFNAGRGSDEKLADANSRAAAARAAARKAADEQAKLVEQNKRSELDALEKSSDWMTNGLHMQKRKRAEIEQRAAARLKVQEADLNRQLEKIDADAAKERELIELERHNKIADINAAEIADRFTAAGKLVEIDRQMYEAMEGSVLHWEQTTLGALESIFSYEKMLRADDPFNFDPDAKLRDTLAAMQAMEDIANNLNAIEAQKPRGERDIEARNRASGGEFRQYERGRFKFDAGSASKAKQPVETGLEGVLNAMLAELKKPTPTGATAQ